DEHPVVVVRRIMTEDPPKPSEVNRDVSRALDKIVMAALKRDRRKRTNTMKAFAEALDNYVRKEVGELGEAHFARWMQDHAAHLCPTPGVGSLAALKPLPPALPPSFEVPGPTMAEDTQGATEVL